MDFDDDDDAAANAGGGGSGGSIFRNTSTQSWSHTVSVVCESICTHAVTYLHVCVCVCMYSINLELQ